MNLLLAFANNPVSNLDPDGRSSLWDILKGNGIKQLMLLFRLAGALVNAEVKVPDFMKKFQEQQVRIEKVTKASKKIGTASGGGGPGSDPEIDEVNGKLKGPTGPAVSIIVGLGLIALESLASAVEGVMSHMAGDNTSALASMFDNLDNGNSAFADLDAITAALEISGGAGSAATVAFGVFAGIMDEYNAGMTSGE